MGMGMLGALGGLGEAGVGIGKQMMAAALREDELKFLETAKLRTAEAEMKMKKGYADQAREDSMSRIGAAKEGLLNSAIGQKYAGSDAAVSAADSGQTDMALTDEQRAVINQVKGADKSKLSNMRGIDSAAAMKAGEYDLAVKLKSIDQRDESQEEARRLRETVAQGNLEARNRDLARKEQYTDWRVSGGTAARGGSGGSGSGGSRSSGSADKPENIEKIVDATSKKYGGQFDGDEKKDIPEDLYGKNAFEKLVRKGISAGVNPGDAALASIELITKARKAATDDKGVLDMDKYKAKVNEIFAYKMKGEGNLGDEAPNNEEYLRNAYSFPKEGEEQPAKKYQQRSGGAESSSWHGSKPVANVYGNAGPSNPRLAAMPAVPLAQMLDIVRGKKNHEAVGKPFNSSADGLLAWMNRE